jgi:hypothetical protein
MTTFTKTTTPQVPGSGKVEMYFTLAGLPAYVGADGQPVTLPTASGITAEIAAAVAASAATKLNLADPAIAADDAFYFGPATTLGSWRIIRDGDNLLSQRLEEVGEEPEVVDTWVTKQTILAAE